MHKFKNFFEFGKSEFRGVVFLLIILTLLMMLNIVFSNVSRKDDYSDPTFAKKVSNFEIRQQFLKDSIALARKSWNNKKYDEVSFFEVDKSIMKNELTPFPFNPNNLSVELWKEMGLTEKQIKSIKNFESKGGKFKTKEDLKKMYSISAEEYAILEPYITIPVDTISKSSVKKIKFAQAVMEINSADSLELQKIPGIGMALARRIVQHREKLGGFYNVNQLEEIFGIDSLKFSKIRTYFTLDKSKVKLLNINTAEVKDMVKHPYLDLYMAKSIVVHRKKIGRYTSVTQIRDAALIYDELYQKLIPYLTTQ